MSSSRTAVPFAQAAHSGETVVAAEVILSSGERARAELTQARATETEYSLMRNIVGRDELGRTFARHFGTPPDLMEDPFTGSASGGMGAYLAHHRIVSKSRLHVEQGHLCGRAGEGDVEIVGPPDDIQTVKVGGPAITVMRGELLL